MTRRVAMRRWMYIDFDGRGFRLNQRNGELKLLTPLEGCDNTPVLYSEDVEWCSLHAS